MPRGDGTGPNGQGAMTGRGMGYCAGYVNPGYGQGQGQGQGQGRGLGMGMGMRRGLRGRGWGYNAWANTPYGPMMQAPVNQTPTPEDEKAYLKDQAKMMEEELKAIKQRLYEIK